MKDWHVLVVDDDDDTAKAIAVALSAIHCRCDIVESGTAALEACRQSDFDLVVTDVRMDGMSGFELLARLQRLSPGLPVILLTGAGTIPDAVAALKQGARHYLTKPCDAAALCEAVTNALATRARKARAPREKRPPVRTADLIGKSAEMSDLRARIDLVARAHSPVLIQGETGTGKELVACAIHAGSPRCAGPFVTVNASAIPETLLESQMFGHARGAFTGATQAHRGMFAEADAGTLLLDEIGDMPLPLQAKLLRVLQSGEIRPVGGDRTSYVDVRVIAATHRSLTALVREGKFRDDLFYRLNVVTVVLPPLRARASDIPELASYFLDSARQRAPESPARSLSPELVDALVQASWPGNVRELESVIERLVVLATHAELTLADLGVHLDDDEGATSTKREPSDPSLEGLIRDHVESILERTGGNKALAAKMLGIDLSTLYRWQRKWSS